MDAIVIGGGVSGLAAALGLARHGARVTVLERDATEAVADAEAAFAAPRRGVPQSWSCHVFKARCRSVLRQRAPEAYQRLLAAGAHEVRLCDLAPPDLEDRRPQPGDDELVGLATRRTTFEWALRETARAEPAINLRTRTPVAGLVIRSEAGAVRVVGVRTQAGEELRAPVVVDATGRRSPLRAWLSTLGLELPPDEVEECGIVYYSRFYRLRARRSRPAVRWFGDLGAKLPSATCNVMLADNDVFSVAVVADSWDDALRALRHDRVFAAVVATLPAIAPWVDPQRSEPITPVRPMAQLTSRYRSLLAADRPPLLGLHLVGDALAHTNPRDGWGCSLAVVHAFGLADVIAGEPDLASQAEAAADFAAREIDPWYHCSVANDRHRQATRGAPTAPGGAEVGDEGDDAFVAAMHRDAVVFRAALRVDHLLAPPDLLASPEVAARVARFASAAAPVEPWQPSRSELLATIDAAS